MKISQPDQPTPALPQLPKAIPPPPIPTSTPGAKPQAKSMNQSYLNAGAAPSKDNIGTKQLVGQ
jgi:hypothetical protein